MQKMHKIVLISPTATRPGFISKFFRFPPLNLALLAALAPDNDYTIIDENIDTVEYDSEKIQKADIIGLTVMTAQAPRAYELADRMREMGKTVIMGGIHVSALPEEALEHCDAVVVGEAEGIWPKLLEDCEGGKLQKIYKNKELPDLSDLPVPRRNLLKRKNYLGFNTLHVSRGCPFNCFFCAVSRFFGARYRFRPVKEVIKEIETMIEADKISFWRKAIAKLWDKAPVDPFAFLDDNIFGQKEYARELFEALAPLRIFWGGQASVNVATPENEDLLKLAAKSGCRFLFIGFESIDQSSLTGIGKKVNKPEMYAQAVKLLHKYGITVLGAFVFGFDGEDETVFKRTVDFAKLIKLDLAQFAILTPLPGTRLMEKLREEKRILDENWSRYSFRTAVFEPSGMSPEELTRGKEWAWQEFYSWSSILRRLPPLTNLPRLLVYAISNIAYRLFRRPG
ncbi:B12-binding domain-containing radical SAM protein [Candidatus Aerophobetes bacterium]|nr:B12-binding domain-containing radical SAM protein [Candidatus Aerophobetes bacterium]